MKCAVSFGKFKLKFLVKINCKIIRYKFLLLKIAISFSVVWVNSTCFILLYGGDVFVFHLLAYCLLCGDMSVNPLLLITHCQDENRQLISFWNEYS